MTNNQLEAHFHMEDPVQIRWSLLSAAGRIALYLGGDCDQTVLGLYFEEAEHLEELIRNATDAHAALVRRNRSDPNNRCAAEALARGAVVRAVRAHGGASSGLAEALCVADSANSTPPLLNERKDPAVTPDVHNWRRHAARLAEELEARSHGRIGDQWLQAFRDVPRHEFMSTVYTRIGSDPWEPLESDDPEWLSIVYSPLPSSGGVGGGIADRRDVVWPDGSGDSDDPLALAELLQALDVAPQHRVLVVGRGGYSAAVLSQYVDGENVYAIDLDGTASADRAVSILDFVGLHPVVVAGAIDHGLPEHGPFDRIVSTIPLAWIPVAWWDQLAPGGRVVAPFMIGPMAGSVVALDHVDGAWEGRFRLAHSDFRHWSSAWRPASVDDPDTGTRPGVAAVVSRGETMIDPDQWALHPHWWLAHLANPMPGLRFGRTVDGVTDTTTSVHFATDDGSWAEVAYHPDIRGRRAVVQGGPTMVWDNLEHGAELARELGFPDWHRFGLTVGPAEGGTGDGLAHTVWLDNPSGEHRWTLPALSSAHSVKPDSCYAPPVPPTGGRP